MISLDDFPIELIYYIGLFSDYDGSMFLLDAVTDRPNILSWFSATNFSREFPYI